MKKYLLLAGIIACLFIITAAFATAYFNGDSSKIITADSAIILSLGENETIDSLTLEYGKTTVYAITATVNRSSLATETINGTLKITISNGVSQTLDDVAFSIYSNAECTGAKIADREDNAITVANIESTTTYYLAISLKNDPATYTADQLKNIGGKISIQFYIPEEGGNA